MDADLISTERLRIAFALPNLRGCIKSGRTRARRRRRLLHNLDSLLEPPSSRRAMSIASVSASLSAKKGNVSYMNVSNIYEYSLHLG
ncbi:Tail collar protein [Phytophthora palmivora]|uniref:Tail collar protein n=1 Tax=Phytophthora palmivora TaxID=4796 RepID=A0A2P4XG59_9STRA|nr:Tail collar protein [Phytophthora palmivora]